jgi:hypothetical protein
MFNLVHAEYVTDATSVITTAVGDLATIIFAGLTAVLGFVVVVMGVMYAVKLVRRWIGGAR